MPFPLPLEALLGKPLMVVLYALIGLAFGFVLESSGFGNSKKLANQFYFKDMTVLKVMFGAIVTAMVLIFAAVGLGLLDFNLVWVNPTYLWSGILGGLIMGVGFIIGGFCPGTSLVALTTFKVDGLFFVLGGLFGIFLFGESEILFDQWYNLSGYLGRFTFMDWLGLPTGVVVLGVVLMALFMFWGAEQLERLVGGRDLTKEPKVRVTGALALIAVALFVLVLGDMTTEDKWTRIALAKDSELAARSVYIHPGELLASIENNGLKVIVLDVRPEAEYNLFHLHGARNTPLPQIKEVIPELTAQAAPNTVVVVMSNDETAATAAWKTLVAESVNNVYILEGGVNNWLATFASSEEGIAPVAAPGGDDTLRYAFAAALGDRYAAADPDPHAWTLSFAPKIKLQLKAVRGGGGCG